MSNHYLEHNVAVTAAWVVANADRAGVHIIDVRPQREFRGTLGHIPGAVCVPLDRLASHVATWDRAAPIVLVCRAGIRSEAALEHLEDLGFTHAVNLTGGMLAYRRLPRRRLASIAA